MCVHAFRIHTLGLQLQARRKAVSTIAPAHSTPKLKQQAARVYSVSGGNPGETHRNGLNGGYHHAQYCVSTHAPGQQNQDRLIDDASLERQPLRGWEISGLYGNGNNRNGHDTNWGPGLV
jgi:hypothetical protein